MYLVGRSFCLLPKLCCASFSGAVACFWSTYCTCLFSFPFPLLLMKVFLLDFCDSHSPALHYVLSLFVFPAIQ